MSWSFKTSWCANGWGYLKADLNILNIVKIWHIELDDLVFEVAGYQDTWFSKYIHVFSFIELVAIENEIEKRLILSSLLKPNRTKLFNITHIFKTKENGEYRMIVNLKHLNTYIPYYHLQVETFEQALTPKKAMFMASIDPKMPIIVSQKQINTSFTCV